VPELLAVFDGNSLAHRAYHALPALWVRGGEPMHAVFGFGSMLFKALDELRPRYAAVAFDTPEPTFRHAAYPEYKAQRAPAPSDLYPQFPYIRRLAEGLGLACIERPGFEADDVLGTLAEQAARADLDVVVVTGDSDALQLVGSRVRVLMPLKGLTETILYDEAAVRARHGVPPALIADLKALKGDPSDNIAGLRGIGPKTAAALLTEHGGLEALLVDGRADGRNGVVVPEKHRQALLEHADRLRQARMLTTICRDVPIELDLATCCVHEYDRGRAVALLRSMGLGRLAARLPDYGRPKTAPTPKRTPEKRSPSPQLRLF
jgi:DNA polymerase-1